MEFKLSNGSYIFCDSVCSVYPFWLSLVKGGENHYITPFSLLEGHRLSECLLDKPSGVTRVVHGEDTVCNLTRVPWDLFSAIAPRSHVSSLCVASAEASGSLWHRGPLSFRRAVLTSPAAHSYRLGPLLSRGVGAARHLSAS